MIYQPDKITLIIQVDNLFALSVIEYQRIVIGSDCNDTALTNRPSCNGREHLSGEHQVIGIAFLLRRPRTDRGHTDKVILNFTLYLCGTGISLIEHGIG
ncbi:MAG: hypothetical protein ACLR8S_17770 [Paraprevotella clara]